MVETVLRRSQRRAVGRMAAAVAEYAEMGWPVCLGAFPPSRPGRSGLPGRTGREPCRPDGATGPGQPAGTPR